MLSGDTAASFRYLVAHPTVEQHAQRGDESKRLVEHNVVSRLGHLDDGRSRSHQGRHVGRRFARNERALFSPNMSAARQPTACKYSRTGSPKRREPMASLSNFQTQPFSARLSEWRPMNSTMKGLSQGCSGIRRKRANAASKVSMRRGRKFARLFAGG